MRTFTAERLLLGALLVFSSTSPVFGQLPDGAGKDALLKVCGVCHDPATAASVRLTRDGWQATINDMVSRGAKAGNESVSHPHGQHPEQRARDGSQHAKGGEVMQWQDMRNDQPVELDQYQSGGIQSGVRQRFTPGEGAFGRRL